jgi:hypothetical protein
MVLDENATFESLKADLVRRYPGQFAVLCGDSLLGVYDTVDDALMAVSSAFDERSLPEAVPVLISEIADPVTVRVTARPYPREASAPPAGAPSPL